MRNRTRLLPATLVAASLTACGGGGDQGGSSDGGPRGRFAERDSGPPAVEAVEVMYGSFPLEERLSGSVRARNQTEIFAEVSGTIEQVFVEDGDRVETGDPLVQLRARDVEERVQQAEAGLKVAEARVRQAEANLERMQANLERVQSVVERGLGTQAELDTARADTASAQADLDLAEAERDQAASALEEQRAALADTMIRAPIDGIVGGRNAEVGQQAGTSTALFTIGNTGSLQVDLTLTQQMLDYIDVGTTVNIYTDTRPDDVIEADITRISPFLHPVTHTTRAQINVGEAHASRLRPGMFVTVDVLYGESEQSPLIPNSAIYRNPRNGREGVFMTNLDEELQSPETAAASTPVDASQAEPVGPVSVQFVPVEVVARGRTSSGVRGVEEGDWVVTLGHHLLANSAGESQQAVVQPTPWQHILDLQQMQSRDLLDIIREKQQQTDVTQVEPN